MTAQTKATLLDRAITALVGAAATMVLGLALDVVILPHRLKAQGDSHEQRITAVEERLRKLDQIGDDVAYLRGRFEAAEKDRLDRLMGAPR
jgi:hypothetical protein